MSSCTYLKTVKQKILREGTDLMTHGCCSLTECTLLSKEIEELQHKCNDAFSSEEFSDEKGNIYGTVCDKLKEKKIQLFEKINMLETQRGRGKKTKRKTKKSKRKNKRKNKTRKYTRTRRHSKKHTSKYNTKK